MQNQIKEFNDKLVENNIDIGIIDYVKNINAQFYNIDMNFIETFIDLVDKDFCCIPHSFLKTCGITNLTAGSSDVKRILTTNNGAEGIDYIVQVSTNADLQEQISYVLHPIIFKKILIRSRKTDKYADYYLLLEMCIKYYNDYYQLKLKKKIEEDNKIKLLLLMESETLDNFTIFKCDEDTLCCRRSRHYKGYLFHPHDYNEYPYALINGSDKNVKKIIKACKIKEKNQLVQLKCPSYTNFLKKIKEVLGDKYERETTFYEDELEDERIRTSVTRFFKLKDISEDDFIKEIKKLHTSRGS